ncbi:hypothetical protein, partial [Proteus vulgaris]|uniref:hypothetical protein n=1 Tax=Proteus vulgaris TaxID=585 RepID=UPI002362D244
YPYHSSESDCNTSHFLYLYLHIAQQTKNGIRYIQDRYRHNYHGIAKTPFVPRYLNAQPN